MSSHYSEYIQDANGNQLQVSPTRLVQVSPDHISDNPWYATARDLRAAYRRAKASEFGHDKIMVYEKSARKRLKSLRVSFVLPTHSCMAFLSFHGQIGCATFTAEVFNKIMKKVRRRKPRTKKVGR